MALVLVLSFLVLISALMLAFYSSVTTELQGATSYSAEVRSKNLADSAVQTVMGAIRTATSRGTGVAWASQPGMIRTYGTASGSASGAPLSYYKLYSSDNMEVTASQTASFDPGADVDGQWDVKAALFTDLNSPVLDAQGKLHFPIIDPRVQSSPGVSTVDGFSYSDTLKLNGGGSVTVDQVNMSGSNPDKQRVPMPVKWVYQLKDGTLTAPTGVDGSGLIANWTGAPAYKTPSAANPIVGRIAFWTDDESCKVNINTASEGTYWDVPRIYSDEDVGRFDGSITGMAIYQPTQREYQRYPGHPATTCLSPIFGSLLPVTAPYPISATSADASKLDPYYALTPRVGLANGGGSGGSKGGSYGSPSQAAMTVDTDRLYASMNELIFTPARAQNAGGYIPTQELEKRKFFLTVSGSAPETTLSNTPRISMWPVWDAPNAATAAKRTATDKLLAFCSTIGTQNYFFTRSNARSSTADYTARNTVLYQYLQARTTANIPGFGGNFSTKYGADRDQILTSIYDYIRCVNLSDTSSGATPFTPAFDASNVVGDNTLYYATIRGAGEVVPIKIGNTRGFGRCYGVSAAALVFYGTHATGANTDRMQAVFMLEFASPMQGMAGMLSNLCFKMTGSGLDKFMAAPKSSPPATPSPLGFPSGGTNYIENADASTWAGRSVGGSEGPAMGLTNGWTSTKKIAQGFAPGSPGTALRGVYPFVTGQDFVFSTPTPTFLFTGGDVTMEIRTADTNELLQTVHFTFPNGEFKTPGVDPTYSIYNSRLPVGGLQGGGGNTLIRPTDTVVALETAGTKGNANDAGIDPTAGDTRMIAALADIPSSKFRPHQNYSNPQVQWAHGLRFATGQPITGATSGKLVAVASYNGGICNPEVPSRVGTFVTRTDSKPGDWDTGIGDQKDGAYINKPDEGDKASWTSHVPYELGYPRQFQPSGDTYFSPNRQIPSAMMFGSIPTGVQRFQPWQTLLFHPRPDDPTHPGNASLPKDHLLADLFWMPVVEPYAISQPFSTSGKINLNYQIAPFTNITRSTGIYAVMKSTRFLALQIGDGPNYKPQDPGNGSPATIGSRRYSIDIPATLKAFDSKFASTDTTNNFFKSATQICEMNLVPAGQGLTASTADMAAFWNRNTLTGDNVREKPYVDIYPRLTTKSNAYTVHYRVQVLKKSRSSGADVWDEDKDTVTSEERGASLIERYVDVSNNTLPDFATTIGTPNAPTLDTYYKLRILSTKRF